MFKILFLFVGKQGILREIKWLNKPENTPKNEVYEWQWTEFGNNTVKLDFVSQNEYKRTFSNGYFVYDHIQGTLYLDNISYKLDRNV